MCAMVDRALDVLDVDADQAAFVAMCFAAIALIPMGARVRHRAQVVAGLVAMSFPCRKPRPPLLSSEGAPVPPSAEPCQRRLSVVDGHVHRADRRGSRRSWHSGPALGDLLRRRETLGVDLCDRARCLCGGNLTGGIGVEGRRSARVEVVVHGS